MILYIFWGSFSDSMMNDLWGYWRWCANMLPTSGSFGCPARRRVVWPLSHVLVKCRREMLEVCWDLVKPGEVNEGLNGQAKIGIGGFLLEIFCTWIILIKVFKTNSRLFLASESKIFGKHYFFFLKKLFKEGTLKGSNSALDHGRTTSGRPFYLYKWFKIGEPC